MGLKNCKILSNKKKIEKEEPSRKDSSDSLYSIDEEWNEIFKDTFVPVTNF